MTDDERISEQAATWLARSHGDGMDWHAFTLWLEADPAHARAYDELALIDADLDAHRDALAPGALPMPANDVAPRRWSRIAGWGGGALAASLALAMLVQPSAPPAQSLRYDAPANRAATYRLADGTSVTLAPSATLAVDGDRLALGGSAYFDVPHRPDRTLSIRAGALTVTDIGTRFAIDQDDGVARVAVAEGRVAVAAPGLATKQLLSAGQSLDANSGSGTIRLARVTPASVGGWRQGKIAFDDQPLLLVARDLTRYSGHKVSVDPALAERRFSGVISIAQGADPGAALAEIVGVDARPADGGTRLVPRR